MKKLIVIISLSFLFVGSSFANCEVRTAREFKALVKIAKLTKSGLRPDFPFPVLWNKNRGHADDHTIVDNGKVWECKIWNDNGKCDAIIQSRCNVRCE